MLFSIRSFIRDPQPNELSTTPTPARRTKSQIGRALFGVMKDVVDARRSSGTCSRMIPMLFQP